MGLLDDAIRDHLELRRRHGADAGDVARQEREALGPVRREASEPTGERPAGGDADEYDPRRHQPRGRLAGHRRAEQRRT